jgi:hypothetical protein
MSELAKWSNFYVIVGSSAGALIGLQFVVLTLIANRPFHGSEEAGAAFGSPTVVHFGAVLFLAVLLNAPLSAVWIAGAIWGILGLGGVLYSLLVIKRMRSQTAYRPVFEDWMFHVALPLAAYAVLAVCCFAAGAHPRASLFSVGAAVLLLLFSGIHNAWDNIAYHVLVQLAGSARQRSGNENKGEIKGENK